MSVDIAGGFFLFAPIKAKNGFVLMSVEEGKTPERLERGKIGTPL
jgi:hypothetical protein